MEIRVEIEGFYWLQNNCWSGAIDRLIEIEENDIVDEFMEYLQEMLFFDYVPTITELNDFIWFDCDDWIAEMIENNEE